MYLTGREVGQRYRKAAEWLQKAAEQGHANAQYKLGEMYANGRGVYRNDSEALGWYRKAAAQGKAYAKERLKKLGENW